MKVTATSFMLKWGPQPLNSFDSSKTLIISCNYLSAQKCTNFSRINPLKNITAPMEVFT